MFLLLGFALTLTFLLVDQMLHPSLTSVDLIGVHRKCRSQNQQAGPEKCTSPPHWDPLLHRVSTEHPDHSQDKQCVEERGSDPVPVEPVEPGRYLAVELTHLR